MSQVQDLPESDLPTQRQELARSFHKQEIMDFSLVLASQGIKHWLEFDGEALILTIEAADGLVAQDLIDLYRTENRGYLDPTLPAGDLELFLAPLLFLSIPVVSYFGIEAMPWAQWWHSRGRADAGAILNGEWWRCLTATTLHADDLHFLSNLVSGYFILNLLNHRLGMGSIMLLASLGGALANLLVAVTSSPNHLSIGFSSVVFSALGLLAAVETLSLPRRTERSLRRLTPLISAFFVAVLVGLGENADIKAHFYGFGFGVALGGLTRFIPKAGARPAWQAAQIGVAYLLYALAWMFAANT